MRTKTLPSISARRGAARLSAVWLIVAFVLLVIVGAFGFIAQDAASKAEKDAQTARQDAESAAERRSEANAELSARSAILGFTADAATIPSDVTAAQAALDDFKVAFPDMEPATTFELALPLAKSAYATLQNRLATQATRIAELEGQVAAERTAKSEMEDTKDGEIRDLRTQLTDLRDTTSSEIARLESANEDLRSEVNTKTGELTDAADAARASEKVAADTKALQKSEKLRFEKAINDIARRSEKADGEIAGASSEYGIGFINLTAADRLSEGTVFRIVSGRPGADATVAKGYAEVTNVGPRLSEIRIFDVVDPKGQPIVEGDKIFNPLYEPKSQRNAVLAGSIEGIYNKPELVQLFSEIGITVQNELSNTTDYLITGGPIFVDEEGEPLEEPLQVSDLAAYAEAKDRGVLIIPMRDVL
ncbi:MAG: hypothetical protein VXZ39_09365, partial [Planctomycetota bacterium]|nr:hypothetical protein [Planctomycetota bacterium]